MINKKGIKNLILEDIKNPIILCDDVVNIDNVMCEYTNEYKFFSPEAIKFVDENFEKESIKNNIKKNSNIYGLINFETYGTKIFLNYEKGDYKTSLATFSKNYKKYIKENNFFVIPIKVYSVLITKNNKIMVINQDNKENTLIDNFVSDEDIVGENISFLSTARRKIKEKIGDLKLFNNKILGVFLSNCCVFSTFHTTDFSSKEIIKNREKTNNIFFIDNNEKSIKDAILSLNLDIDSKISLKLHLKENFEVYEAMMNNK